MNEKTLAETYASKVRELMSLKNAPVHVISSIAYPKFGCVLVKIKPAGRTTAQKVLSLEADLRIHLNNRNVRLSDDRDCILSDITYKQDRDIVLATSLPISANQYEALLGVDVYGNVVANNFVIEQESHLLVVGVSGSGKSAMVQSALASLTRKNTSQTLAMYFIDSKGENPAWFLKYVNPFLRGYAIDPVASKKVIEDASAIMQESQGRAIKRRVIVYVDELAKLIAESDEPTLNLLRGIASTGRSAGVHLIACTQNPIGALVKDLPALFNRRLVGQVQTNRQSVTATGFAQLGAEFLIGRGDFLSIKGGDVKRFQGAILPHHGKYNDGAGAPAPFVSALATQQHQNAETSLSVTKSLPVVDDSSIKKLETAAQFRWALEINFLTLIYTNAPEANTDAARARILWPHLQKLEGGWQRRFNELKIAVKEKLSDLPST